jgi:Uma2 family endonuclease
MIERYWHLCPDFIIEVRSKTDRLRNLREKMGEWIANGAGVAWMIDPENRTVEIYRPNADAETMTNPNSVNGEGPVAGFVLDLPPVWDPLSH